MSRYDAKCPLFELVVEPKHGSSHASQFSVDDFESVKTTPWEGVRNAEARNIMQKMAVGDQVCITFVWPSLRVSFWSYQGLVLSFQLQGSR